MPDSEDEKLAAVEGGQNQESRDLNTELTAMATEKEKGVKDPLLTARAEIVRQHIQPLAREASWIKDLADKLRSVSEHHPENQPVATIVTFESLRLQNEEDYNQSKEFLKALGIPEDTVDQIRDGAFAENPNIPVISREEAHHGRSGTYYIGFIAGDDEAIDSLVMPTNIPNVSLMVDGASVQRRDVGSDEARFLLMLNATDHPFPPVSQRTNPREIIDSLPDFTEGSEAPEPQFKEPEEETEKVEWKFPVGMQVAVRRSVRDEEGNVIEGAKGVMEYDWHVAEPSSYPSPHDRWFKLGKVLVSRTRPNGHTEFRQYSPDELGQIQPAFTAGQEIEVPLEKLPAEALWNNPVIGGQNQDGRIIVMQTNKNESDAIRRVTYAPAELYQLIHQPVEAPKEKKGFGRFFGRR